MAAIWRVAQENGERVRRLVVEKEGIFTLEKVAEMYGLDVHYRDDIPGGVSGMIVKTAYDSRPQIYINSEETLARQRFTLAHEIGHYIERLIEADDQEYSFVDKRDSHNYNLREFYADQFAGGLLMPENEVRALTPDLSNAEAVAHRFHVSLSAAKTRLNRLKKQETLNRATSLG
ncbi:ImmA/IrrE family metallo-endopeptidase [Canibacter oris]|uniref:Zn-dependent peptidase ImmA (M78 family) n=1 Tax=Canibacter oris TaxID=1365628 RepID=A0A840DKN8_9MICO|nr:ImmA/IrrE family metallo-endopeptidase [Canibacter oris]MBB4072032.1 Zn-dependent peptidase ImmA (M78 family) [Canibacter oris]